jgi:hypothetical protein
MDKSHIRVEAFAGAKGEETPRSFTHEGRRRTVTEIVARWYTETHCFFRHDLDRLIWELVMCEATDDGI